MFEVKVRERRGERESWIKDILHTERGNLGTQYIIYIVNPNTAMSSVSVLCQGDKPGG